MRVSAREGRVVLELRGVQKAYAGAAARRVSVLEGVDLRVGAGEFLVLTGASGAGKTTLLNVAGLLDAPDAGTVLFEGAVVRASGAAPLRLRRIGFVFQHHYLVPDLTVRENVLVHALAAGADTAAAARARVNALLERVGLASLSDRLPRELSGGEQQRAGVARALVNRPALVLADEPTASLDAASATAVVGLLAEAAAEGAAVLVATHEPSRFDGLARRVARLERGRVLEPPTPEARP